MAGSAPPSSTPPRRFSVHAADEVRSRAHLIEGRTFEDAALGFAEEWHAAAGADGDAVLIVEDCQTGEQQCFKVDLGSGEARPCD